MSTQAGAVEVEASTKDIHAGCPSLFVKTPPPLLYHVVKVQWKRHPIVYQLIEKLCACVDGHTDGQRQTDTWLILWLHPKQANDSNYNPNSVKY